MRPFLALRSYLPDDHPDKHLEIGSEPDPATFIDTLLALTADWDRVLTPHGSICVELGDTYSGSGGSGGDYRDGHLREGQAKWSGSARRRGRENDRPARTGRNGNDLGQAAKDTWASSDNRPGWPLAKSMALIPELYRIGLAYGINPLTGQPSPAGRWRVRNTVTWVRPNPPVGALGDKFRPATSDLVIACKAKDRWFDLDAVRQPYSENSHPRVAVDVGRAANTTKTSPDGNRDSLDLLNNDGSGAPPLDWWEISPSGYSGAHYAVYPPELCVKPIKAMCPLEVCTACSEPRRRITEASYEPHGDAVQQNNEPRAQRGEAEQGVNGSAQQFTHSRATKHVETVGWTDCGCGAPFRPGVVLDPFAGTGTTLMVATGHGRQAIGIDLDARNADLARERLGMFLEVEHHGQEAAA